MKTGQIGQCGDKPSEFNIIKLHTNFYELEYKEDIKQVEVNHGEVEELQYEYNHYLESFYINNYEEMVADLISLKYSISDEIALLKKIQNNVDKSEISSYLDYVEKCKIEARKYWGLDLNG